MQIVEPLKEKKTIAEYITAETKKIGIVFFHGLGDCVQFIALYQRLQTLYPKIHFDILLQKGLDQKVVYPEGIELDSLDRIKKMDDYDYIFLVHFPVETDPTLTKGELSCKLELGIDYQTISYGQIPTYSRRDYERYSKLIGIHFQNTALPGVFNPTDEVAKKIWDEVLDAGFIPIELDFTHPYHNPVNKKPDFIDCTVRRVKPTIDTLLGLLVTCQGVIAVPSGPLHCALSVMPNRVLFLKKKVPIERFVNFSVPSIDLENYKDGEVKKWAEELI